MRKIISLAIVLISLFANIVFANEYVDFLESDLSTRNKFEAFVKKTNKDFFVANESDSAITYATGNYDVLMFESSDESIMVSIAKGYKQFDEAVTVFAAVYALAKTSGYTVIGEHPDGWFTENLALVKFGLLSGEKYGFELTDGKIKLFMIMLKSSERYMVGLMKIY